MQEFTGKKLTSTVTPDGLIQLQIKQETYASLKDGDVLIQVEASPVNPSDVGVMLHLARNQAMQEVSVDGEKTIQTQLPAGALAALKPRIGMAFPCGNEGTGTVVAAGASEAAQKLIGTRVAVLGGGMYATYRKANAAMCLPLPSHVTAEQGAACFINPLTALGMVETMKAEGHTALVHTAAASNLGQMLQKICLADGIDLVNVVRNDAAVKTLRDLGAKYVVNSSDDDYKDQLVNAIAATGATIAFDAIGGGEMADQLLTAMESALSANNAEFSNYGSTTHKQVYVYGGLASGPVTLHRSYGMYWSVGGFLLTAVLNKIGAARAQQLRERVVAEITTTFASNYDVRISLDDMLTLPVVEQFSRQATGKKILVLPN